MQQIGEQIGRVAPRPTAPPEVRDRLFKAIARARTASATPNRPSGIRRTALAGIASVLVGVGAAGYLAVRNGLPDRPEGIASIVEDQLRSRKGAGLVSSDSLQVTGWLAERLPFVVQIPLFPDARLTGVRLLVDHRRSGAVVEYAAQGRLLTYYVMPGGATGTPRQVRLASRDGYRIASWHDAGLTHALVATLPGPRLIEYARYCIHQMMAG
jgi:anti-sigma factor RsiW